ncbi:MAG: RNA polymerase sigma factor RpoD/SigA [Bacilli bacterium]|nr:RNA polymerase sigma factor RpoD/SigA [Bacilli bacterium]
MAEKKNIDKNSVKFVGASSEEDALTDYKKDISSYPLLSEEEEVRLIARAKEGDEEAKDTLVLSNLRLVLNVAFDYAHRGVSLMDLIQEGTIGLMVAVEKFDPSLGNRFSTYAVPCIKSKMEDAIANQSGYVNIPSYLFKKMARIYAQKESLLISLGREPTPEEIAENIPNCSSDDVRYCMSLSESVRAGSPHRKKNDQNEDFEIEIPDFDEGNDPHKTYVNNEAIEAIFTSLGKLSPIEQDVIVSYFGLNGHPLENCEDIASRYELSAERIRQIRNDAIIKLRKMVNK